jgi:hypothetical protein
MSFETEEDRQVLIKWVGEKEASEVLEDPKLFEFDPTRGEETDTDGDGNYYFRRRGGRVLSENLDHFYQTHFLVSNHLCEEGRRNDYLNDRIITAMRGMHQHPNIPLLSANGIVSIDLEAARSFFAKYFQVECEIAPLNIAGRPKYSTFRLNIDASDYQDLFDAIVRQQQSLTTYHQHHISLKDALFTAINEDRPAAAGPSSPRRAARTRAD